MTRFSLPNRGFLPLLAVLLTSAGLVRADAPAMNPATLRKVKRATVQLLGETDGRAHL